MYIRIFVGLCFFGPKFFHQAGHFYIIWQNEIIIKVKNPSTLTGPCTSISDHRGCVASSVHAAPKENKHENSVDGFRKAVIYNTWCVKPRSKYRFHEKTVFKYVNMTYIYLGGSMYIYAVFTQRHRFDLERKQLAAFRTDSKSTKHTTLETARCKNKNMTLIFGSFISIYINIYKQNLVCKQSV